MPPTWFAVFVCVIFFYSYVTPYFSNVSTPGTVIGYYMSTADKGRIREVVYRYVARGKVYEVSELVDEKIYEDVSNGKRVLSVNLSPNPINRQISGHISGNRGMIFPLFFGALFCLISCGIAGVFVWLPCRGLLRSYRLVRNGVATKGTITNVPIIESGLLAARSSVIDYSYETRSYIDGLLCKEIRHGKMRVKNKEIGDTKPGDAVTVLYDEKDVRQSLIYKYAAHKACL